MKRGPKAAIALLLPAVLLCLTAQAAAPAGPWSGADLFRALEGLSETGARQDESGQERSSRLAQAYIAGVADATSGAQWCGAGQVLPHELADRVYTHYRELPPARQTQPAALGVIEALTKAFPCPLR